MCIDGNRAPLSARYLNSQLIALWQNAHDCVRWASHHGGDGDSVNLSSEDYNQHKYQRALAQFHYMGVMQSRSLTKKDDLFFTASFGKPRLEFICNHDAVIHLKIERGHLNKAFHKTKSANRASLNRMDNVSIEGLELAFRMTFSNSKIQGSDSRIAGGHGYTIQLMILNFDSARLVMSRPPLASDTKEALTFYLHQYLKHLAAAGHNCLLNLPAFDDVTNTAPINYSLTTKAIEADLSADVLIHGTSVMEINEQLRSAWLRVASFTHATSNERSACLAEVKTFWMPRATDHYHIHFAPPTVKALCDNEVVLYYNIDELKIYESAEFAHELTTIRDFSVAFVVTVLKTNSDSDALVLELDLKNAQFARHLSRFSLSREIMTTYISDFVEFLLEFYIELVIEEQGPLYRQVPPRPDTPDPGFSVELPELGSQDIIQESTSYGYDQFFTITQESINALLRSLWATAKRSSSGGVIYTWNLEEKIRATFEEPYVRLLSDGTIIFWVTIASGRMHADAESDTNIGGWRLAFQVPLKQIEQREGPTQQVWWDRIKENLVGRELEGWRTVAHLIHDFESAIYLHDHSSFDGLFDSGSQLAISRLRAIRGYMATYFEAFSNAGHHVIHSTPTYAGAKETRITSVTYQVVSKTTVTIANVFQKHEAPVIVILGMTNDRPLSRTRIVWNAALTAKKNTTVTLSRKGFLDVLLDHLALVNARTTIVPRFPADDEDEWTVHLTTWDKHGHRRNRKCRWTTHTDNSTGKLEYLKYKWEHRDVWVHEHTGTLETTGAFNLICHTSNELIIPTSFRRGGMDIRLIGQSAVNLRGSEEGKDWSKRSAATWTAVIRISSMWDGLHVSLAEEVKPVFQKTEETGTFAIGIDTQQLLSDQLPKIVDMGSIIEYLRQVLEGHWKYSTAGMSKYNMYSPVFNTHGDLILTLNIHDPSSQPSSGTSAAQIGVDGAQSSNGGDSSDPNFSPRPSPGHRRKSGRFVQEFAWDEIDGSDATAHDLGGPPIPQSPAPESARILVNGTINSQTMDSVAHGRASGDIKAKLNGKTESASSHVQTRVVIPNVNVSSIPNISGIPNLSTVPVTKSRF